MVIMHKTLALKCGHLAILCYWSVLAAPNQIFNVNTTGYGVVWQITLEIAELNDSYPRDRTAK